RVRSWFFSSLASRWLGGVCVLVGCVGTEASPDVAGRAEALGDDEHIVASQPVGTLPGQLSVDAQGNATYAIALQVPPGRGATPSLALEYRSGAGNGPL